MPLKIAVLASHGGSNMQAIVDGVESSTLDARVVLVISNNSKSGAIQRAEKHGLPWRHISGATHPGEGVEDLAIRDALEEAGAEIVVLAGYMKMIGPETLAAFRGRILNIHPALLPKHGGQGMYGMRPHEAVIAAGDTESGATVHVVDEHYDHGPVVKQRKVPVLPDDDAQTLQERVLKEEHVIYREVIADIAAGRIVLPPSD